LLLFFLSFFDFRRVGDEGCQSDHTEAQSWVGVLLSGGATSGKDFLESKQEIVINVSVGLVVDHVKETGHTFLAFFKLERLLLSTLFIIDQKWLDEFNELIDGTRRRDFLVVLDYSFANAQGDNAFVLKLHVVHQSRVVMHFKNLDGECIEWDG